MPPRHATKRDESEPETKLIILSLPFPISVNRMYKNKGSSRAKSKPYKEWIKAAGWEVTQQKQKPIMGWYSMTLILNEKDNRRRDPDNFIKSVSDILVTHKLIRDDCFCSSLHVQRFKAKEASCEVIIQPTDGIQDRTCQTM